MDDLALLRLELETLWVTADDGRLLHCRTPEAAAAPLVVVGSSGDGICWATSVDVPAPVVGQLAGGLARAAPADVVGWRPESADDVLAVLQAMAPTASAVGGPSYLVPSGLPSPGGIELRTSIDTDLAQLDGVMPEADRALASPWVVAMANGYVAAVCETARSAPASVEAGVWTYVPFRRRGIASAVTAAWAGLVTDRTAFYSTSWDNLASQGVARRLGLRPLGHWWQVIVT